MFGMVPRDAGGWVEGIVGLALKGRQSHWSRSMAEEFGAVNRPDVGRTQASITPRRERPSGTMTPGSGGC